MPHDAEVCALIAVADDACHAGDMATLSRAARALIPHVPRPLQYDAVAIAELAALAEPVACERWWARVRPLITALGGGSGAGFAAPVAA